MKKSQQILVLNTFAIIMVCIGHSFTAVESYYGHKWIVFICHYSCSYQAIY